jgi:hypothetical protein
MACHTCNRLASTLSGGTDMPEQIDARTLKARLHDGEIALLDAREAQPAGTSLNPYCTSSSKLRGCTVSNMVASMSGTWR